MMQLIQELWVDNMSLSNKHFFTGTKYALNDDFILKIRNLQVKFKVRDGFMHAVRGVNFSIKQGQIVAIIGESGSGKSVSSKSFIGFNERSITTADLMNLCNVNLLSLKKKDWKYIRGNYIGYIPQDPLLSLNPTKKIGKQIFETIILNEKRKYYDARLKIHLEKHNSNEKRKLLIKLRKEYKYQTRRKNIVKKTIEILNFIGIENANKRLNSFPHEFSGGMRQRIAIAIAVAARPKLIIADEPTTALDVTVQAKVLDLIKQLRDVYKITVIFISHNIALVANFCDYIYVMYAGKIVEQGTVREILTDPRHPYTWALIGAIPEDIDDNEKLEYIPGVPPNLLNPPIGDAFAARNKYAMKIDFEKEPPLVNITKTHKAATWLLHEFAPKVSIPESTRRKIATVLASFEALDKTNNNTDAGKD